MAFTCASGLWARLTGWGGGESVGQIYCWPTGSLTRGTPDPGRWRRPPDGDDLFPTLFGPNRTENDTKLTANDTKRHRNARAGPSSNPGGRGPGFADRRRAARPPVPP